MKISRVHFFTIIFLVSFVTLFHGLPVRGGMDVAEIAKIEIDEYRVAETEQLWRYKFAETAGYVQLKPVREWDFLEPGDVIQTLEDLFVRLEFTTVDYLYLGKGAAGYSQCQSEDGEQVCAAARFNGLQTSEGFCYMKNSWYLDYGSAFVNSDNICLYDSKAEVEPGGTQFYMSSTRQKTTIVVLDGRVRVRALNDSQRRIFTYPEGAHIEIGATATQPTLLGRVGTNPLADIRHWVGRGMVVISDPQTGTPIYESKMPVEGRVSAPDVNTVEIVVDGQIIQQIPVRNQEFKAVIPSPGGQRSFITVRANSQNYGEISDTVTVFPSFSQPPVITSTGTKDVTITSGEPITFSWQTQYADEVLLNGKRVALSGSHTEKPSQTTTYRLLARNADGEDAREFTVTVKTPVVIATETPRIQIIPPARLPVTVEVPDIRKLLYDDATERLEQLGLQAKVVFKPSNRVHVVIQQDPQPGRSVAHDSHVTLYVGEVPDEILCMSVQDAKNSLTRNYQFSPNQIAVDYTSDSCGQCASPCTGKVVSYHYNFRSHVVTLTMYMTPIK